MNTFLQILLNCGGVGVCVLAICGLQWAFFQLVGQAMPKPFKQAEFKNRLANSLYRGYNRQEYNKYLNPFRQKREQDKSCDTDDYDNAPTGLFSSIWTQFILLIDTGIFVIIKRLSTKCKQNLPDAMAISSLSYLR